LCHLLYPMSAAHTSIFRMDSNSTSYQASQRVISCTFWGFGVWGLEFRVGRVSGLGLQGDGPAQAASWAAAASSCWELWAPRRLFAHSLSLVFSPLVAREDVQCPCETMDSGLIRGEWKRVRAWERCPNWINRCNKGIGSSWGHPHAGPTRKRRARACQPWAWAWERWASQGSQGSQAGYGAGPLAGTQVQLVSL
jgi:hypothetical protein